MTEPLIRDVSDTAFWIAHLRTLEPERADALFRDPLAVRLNRRDTIRDGFIFRTEDLQLLSKIDPSS